jgi:phosphomannomutase/phosphoglucomutase
MKSETIKLNQSIFRGSDIRGRYPDEINEEVFEEIGEKLAGNFDDGLILVAYDGRKSSPSLAKASEEGIKKGAKKNGKNLKVEMVGLSTTPMFYFLANELKASGGIMITASHNPPDENGAIIIGKNVKLLSGEDLKGLCETKSKI